MPHSFLFSYPAITNALITPVVMFFDIKYTHSQDINNKIENQLNFTALWDTGAGCSCIKPSALKKLNITEDNIITYREVTGVNSITQKKPVYKINLILPNHVIFPQWSFVESDIASNTDILLGMDIISRGNFIIDNSNNATKFMFSMPPVPIVNVNIEQHNNK